MHRIWSNRKRSLDAAAGEFNRRSPAVELLDREDTGDEWRSIWLFLIATLARKPNGVVTRTAPVTVGVRYREAFLGEAPHPFEVVTILQPRGLFHPNVAPTGALCLGHPEPGLSLEFILHQTWAALTFNMRKINTRRGDVVNPEAAQFVRANAERFPLTEKGIFEEPDSPRAAGGPSLFTGIGQ